MFVDEKMMHIEETPDADKKEVLSQEDIDQILMWTGSEAQALKTLNITRDQFRYVRDHYTADGRLNYRRNLNVISYD